MTCSWCWLFLETSWRGVVAVGDVRSGSIKRETVREQLRGYGNHGPFGTIKDISRLRTVSMKRPGSRTSSVTRSGSPDPGTGVIARPAITRSWGPEWDEAGVGAAQHGDRPGRRAVRAGEQAQRYRQRQDLSVGRHGPGPCRPAALRQRPAAHC